MTDSDQGAAGKKLRAAVLADLPPGWQLDHREEAILDLAAAQADDLNRLERAVRRDGVMSTGSKGQPVLHPAIAEARQSRVAIQKLLAQVDLPEAEAERNPFDVIAGELKARREAGNDG